MKVYLICLSAFVLLLLMAQTMFAAMMSVYKIFFPLSMKLFVGEVATVAVIGDVFLRVKIIRRLFIGIFGQCDRFEEKFRGFRTNRSYGDPIFMIGDILHGRGRVQVGYFNVIRVSAGLIVLWQTYERGTRISQAPPAVLCYFNIVYIINIAMFCIGTHA